MACTASSTTIPSPAATWYSFSSPRSRVPRNSRSFRCSATLFPFLNECHKVRRNGRLRLAPYRHAAPFLLDHDLLACLLLVGVGIVAARVAAPALGPLEGRARGRLGDDEQGVQVDGGVPAGVVFAAAGHPHLPRPPFELLELGERVFETGLVADDPRVALHDRLQCRLHRERILAVARERLERLAHRLLDFGLRDRGGGVAPFPYPVLTGAAPEDEQIAQGIAAEAVWSLYGAAQHPGGVGARGR